MKLINLIFLAIYAALFNVVNSTFLDYDGFINIQIFHALDPAFPDSFSSRGNITVSSISTEDITITQKTLNDDDKLKLRALAQKDKFYRLKLVVSGSDGIRRTFLTSSKACSLIQSHLNDDITISFDHMSAVLGFLHKPYILTGMSCDQVTDAELNRLSEFSTTVTFKTMELAPTPDTASFIQKIEKEREARERGGDSKDNRSFLAKYWMYIVPCVILLLLSGVTNPEAQNGGGSAGR